MYMYTRVYYANGGTPLNQTPVIGLGIYVVLVRCIYWPWVETYMYNDMYMILQSGFFSGGEMSSTKFFFGGGGHVVYITRRSKPIF